MIKCPKCQFEQPEDIYCAQCGINMKTFVAPKASVLLGLLTNQVFHVGLLFVGIIVFVLYDYSTSKKPSTPTTVGEVARRNSQPLDTPDSQAPEIANRAENYSVRLQSPAQDIPADNLDTVAATKSIGSRAKATKSELGLTDKPNSESSTASTGPKSAVLVSFYQISRSALNEIQREANSSPFNGEALGGILPKKRITALKSSGEVRPVSNNRYKLDGLPITIFKGVRANDSTKSVGIYMQINTLKNDTSGTQFEVKSWGHVKLQDADDSLFSSEITLNTQSSAFIAGFLPKDKVFNDEEKSLFESDRALKIYTQDDFWEGNTDLIMFVELPDAKK